VIGLFSQFTEERCVILFHCVGCKGICYVIVAGNWFISGLIVGALASSVLTFGFVGTIVWTCEKSTSGLGSSWSTMTLFLTSKYLWKGTCPNVAKKIAGKKRLLNKRVSRCLKNLKKKSY